MLSFRLLIAGFVALGCLPVAAQVRGTTPVQTAATSQPRSDVKPAGATAPQAPGTAAAPGFSTVDLDTLASQLAVQMRTNPALQGAWLRVEPAQRNELGTATRVFRVRRVFDRGRAAGQAREMSRLLDRWLPLGNYLVDPADDTFLPVSELLATLQDRIDLDPNFAGCLVRGLTFEESPGGGLNLMVQGRVSTEPQVEQLERLCAAIMRNEPVWSSAGIYPSTRDTDALSVVRPSEVSAHLFYAEGLQNFWKSRYPEASRALRQASLEAPANLQFHYWRVISDLSIGDPQRAANRMENLVRTFGVEPFSRQRPAILQSMERVQGSLRRQLRELELQAVFNVSRTPKTASR